MANRLARERSPYLLQHAQNPVDWYPWAEEAFERARREDKPIFLSIGYSTCHWCHVMEHESFELDDVARVLNAHFVSIKVDREERPDVDRVYMLFVQATTGAGGWPMSVWLTPELKPFFGGTYFPPTSRWGRPGFVEVLNHLAEAWRTSRGELVASADEMMADLTRATGRGESATAAPLAEPTALAAGLAAFAQMFDARHGGFGGAPKFPRPSELVFLLHAYAVTGEWPARSMAVDTLRAMSLGGMRDHVGGGFHRYSVDAQWRVPHFEKMLYDQAQLVLVYLDAAQVTADPYFASVAEDTLDYVRRELRSGDGAFFSAEDADSAVTDVVESVGIPIIGQTPRVEKREGAFYVWTARELDNLLGPDAAVVARRFGVEPGGNALADPQGEFTGQNILYVAQPIEDVAARSGRTVDDVMGVLARARVAMCDARSRRPRPHLDDKVIAAWNGLMIAASARAARVLVGSPRRDEWEAVALAAAEAVHAHLWRPSERRLLRRYRDGEAAVDAFAEDYAFLTFGLVELFQATGDVRWLDWALALADVQTELFFDEGDGGWFSTTGQDASVLLRIKEDHDGAEPSAASVTVRNLIALGHITGDHTLLDRAERTMRRFGPEIGRAVRVIPFMVANVGLWHAGSTQVVIVGSDSADRRALEDVVARHYLPWGVVVPVREREAARRLGDRLPWVAAMANVDGKAAVYVCDHFTCQAPTSDPVELGRMLEAIVRGKQVGR
jgi:uncharacterized protein YyaL (SSP411 family)